MKTKMTAPRTIHELCKSLADIMAAAMNGEIDEADGRLALNAATRIIEAVQAETRIRALAFSTKQIVPAAIPLDAPIWTVQQIETTLETK